MCRAGELNCKNGASGEPARDDLARDGQATLMFDAGDAGRFRTNVYHAHGGCCAVFRRVLGASAVVTAVSRWLADRAVDGEWICLVYAR